MYQKTGAYLNSQTDAASLAFYRLAFGLMMFLGTVRFALNGWIDKFYIKPVFHFTYYGFSWVKPIGNYTYLIFIISAVSALMVAFGYKYRLGIILFFLSFTYTELMDKTTYLNHYYFISVMSFVLMFLPANVFFSADARKNPKLFSNTVPRYTTDILKLLLAIVYFYAGLAKLNSDWLVNAMPLRIWLTGNTHLPLIGPLLGKVWVAYVFSYVGLVYDLFIVFLLLNRRTRWFAFALVVVFHVLTRILFPIGIFPYVMIVSSLAFFSGGFHRKILYMVQGLGFRVNTPPAPLKRGAASLLPGPHPLPIAIGTLNRGEQLHSYHEQIHVNPRLRSIGGIRVPIFMRGKLPTTGNQQPVTKTILVLFVLIQLLFPFRYLAYPQELFWAEEGFRFSWRVMLMEKAGYTQFRVVDSLTGKTVYVNNRDYLTAFQEKQMSFQPDFILEYAHFLHDLYARKGMADPAVYTDSYVALNGRLSTRYIDPEVNLAKQDESFSHKTWILPFKDTITGFSLLIFLAYPNVAAQQTVTGSVADEQHNPLPGTEVINTNTGTKVKASADGSFSIAAAPAHTLAFYKEGYNLFEEKAGEITGASIIVLAKIIVLNEVVVQQQKDRLYAINHLHDIEETAIYAGKKTEVVVVDNLTANKATNNARQVYAQIVGLTFNENSDGGLQLNIGGRGLNPNRTSNFNTRQNGYDISADVLGYPESYYTTPTEAVSEIQVVRGAASLQYGTQFGGLVNFKLHDPSAKPLEVITRNTAGSYGLLTNFTSLSGTNGKFSYYTFFNYKQADGFRPNMKFNSRNAFANFNYKFNTKTSLHLDYTLFDYLAQQPGGLTDKMFYDDMYQSNRQRNWFDVNWNLFALRLKHKFSDTADFSLQLFGLDASRKTVGFRPLSSSEPDTDGTVRDLIRGKFVNWGAEARYLKKYTLGSKSGALLLGSKYYQARNTSLQGPGSAGAGPDFGSATTTFPNYPAQSDYVYPNINISFFGENIFRISEKFTVTPGFRFEHINTKAEGFYRKILFDNAGNVILNERLDENVVKNRNFLLLGVGLSYKPTTGTEFYSNLSQNYRSVTFSDISTVNPSLSIDPNITDEKGFTSDLGVRGKYSDYLSYDTSVYLLYYDHKIGEYPGANGERFRSNLGTAITYGWEALVNWNIAKTWFAGNENFIWNAFVNNALTGSKYTKSVFPSIENKKVEFVPTYNIKGGTGAGYKNFLASMQVTYISSQFTDATNMTVDRNYNVTGVLGEIPSYFVADFSASYTWRNFKLEAGINNFTNTQYFTRRATGYPGPGILPSEPRTYYGTLQIKL